MRIWSLHPKYLDAKGVVALWRETLLAKNVLEEMNHLLMKLKKRDPERFQSLCTETHFEPHPLFHVIPGEIEDWEIIEKRT